MIFERIKKTKKQYSEACLNWTYLGPTFVFGLDRLN
jgi:hypothetical protein